MSRGGCDLLCLDLAVAERLRGGLDADALEASASRAGALADPTRLAIAAALDRAGAELCVCDLAWIVERSERLASHHVRVLKTAGLVQSRREGRMRMYALTAVGAGLVRAVLSQDAEAVTA